MKSEFKLALFYDLCVRYRKIPGDECDLTSGFKPHSGHLSLAEVCQQEDDRKSTGKVCGWYDWCIKSKEKRVSINAGIIRDTVGGSNIHKNKIHLVKMKD